MAAKTERTRLSDSLVVELNGLPTLKGPAEDRLADHEAEVAAYEARLDGR